MKKTLLIWINFSRWVLTLWIYSLDLVFMSGLGLRLIYIYLLCLSSSTLFPFWISDSSSRVVVWQVNNVYFLVYFFNWRPVGRSARFTVQSGIFVEPSTQCKVYKIYLKRYNRFECNFFMARNVTSKTFFFSICSILKHII